MGDGGNQIDITTSGTVDVNSGTLDIDNTTTTIDATNSSHFKTTGGDAVLTLEGGGRLDLKAAESKNININTTGTGSINAKLNRSCSYRCK